MLAVSVVFLATVTLSQASPNVGVLPVIKVAGLPLLAVGFAVFAFDIRMRVRAISVARRIGQIHELQSLRLSKTPLDVRIVGAIVEDTYFAMIPAIINSAMLTAVTAAFVFDTLDDALSLSNWWPPVLFIGSAVLQMSVWWWGTSSRYSSAVSPWPE